MSNEMNTGPMPSVSKDLDANGKQKRMIPVNGPALSSHGESKARADTDGLQYGTLNPIKPSNRDEYQ